MVHATQPCSWTSAVSIRGSDRDFEERRSSMGISLTPTENRVRRRFGSLSRRSDTDAGIVARTLVLYTTVNFEHNLAYQNDRFVLLARETERGSVLDIKRHDIVQI